MPDQKTEKLDASRLQSKPAYAGCAQRSRSMTLESIAPIDDDPLVSLPTLAA